MEQAPSCVLCGTMHGLRSFARRDAPRAQVCTVHVWHEACFARIHYPAGCPFCHANLFVVDMETTLVHRTALLVRELRLPLLDLRGAGAEIRLLNTLKSMLGVGESVSIIDLTRSALARVATFWTGGADLDLRLGGNVLRQWPAIDMACITALDLSDNFIQGQYVLRANRSRPIRTIRAGSDTLCVVDIPTSLSRLSLAGNNLRTFEILGCTMLKDVVVARNANLRRINISGSPYFSSLNASDCALEPAALVLDDESSAVLQTADLHGNREFMGMDGTATGETIKAFLSTRHSAATHVNVGGCGGNYLKIVQQLSFAYLNGERGRLHTLIMGGGCVITMQQIQFAYNDVLQGLVHLDISNSPDLVALPALPPRVRTVILDNSPRLEMNVRRDVLAFSGSNAVPYRHLALLSLRGCVLVRWLPWWVKGCNVDLFGCTGLALPRWAHEFNKTPLRERAGDFAMQSGRRIKCCVCAHACVIGVAVCNAVPLMFEHTSNAVIIALSWHCNECMVT